MVHDYFPSSHAVSGYTVPLRNLLQNAIFVSSSMLT